MHSAVLSTQLCNVRLVMSACPLCISTYSRTSILILVLLLNVRTDQRQSSKENAVLYKDVHGPSLPLNLGSTCFSRWLQKPFNDLYLPIPVQAYVDDISVCTRDSQQIVKMGEKVETFCNWAKLDIKAQKSALLYERRSGNNWYRRGQPDQTSIQLQDNAVEKYNQLKNTTVISHMIIWVIRLI